MDKKPKTPKSPIERLLIAVIIIMGIAKISSLLSDNSGYTPRHSYTTYPTTYRVSTNSTATPKPTQTPKPTTAPKNTTRNTTTTDNDPYDAKSYAHADDFYYDYYDDFFDYEDAEEYYDSYN